MVLNLIVSKNKNNNISFWIENVKAIATIIIWFFLNVICNTIVKRRKLWKMTALKNAAVELCDRWNLAMEFLSYCFIRL